MNNISYLKSFECFYDFLYWYYEEEVARGLSEDLRDGLEWLLSFMKPCDDGYPIDMALWEYWLEGIHRILQSPDGDYITCDQALEVAIIFLEGFYERGNCSAEGVKMLIDKLILLKNNDEECDEIKDLWMDAFEEEDN